MDVCGEALAIEHKDLLQLAAQAGLDRRWASGEIDQALGVANSFKSRAQAVGLSRALTDTVARQLAINSVNLRP